MSGKTSLHYFIQQLSLILVGLTLIIAGNQITAHVFKIEIGELIAHIGALVFFIGTLHYLFDYNLRREFQTEIASAILGNVNLHKNGLIDSTTDSKEIKGDAFLTSTRLIISVGYSLRFIQTNLNVLQKRSSNQKETTVIHYHPNGATAAYLDNKNWRGTTVSQTVEQLKSLMSKHSGFDESYIRLVAIENILHYNFILTDNYIWIKLYDNCSGVQSEVPAIKIGYGSPYYRHFESDILNLIAIV